MLHTGRCDVNVQNHQQQTPLEYALVNDAWPVVHVLLAHGAVLGPAADARVRALFATKTVTFQDTMRELVYQTDTENGQLVSHAGRAACIQAAVPVAHVAYLVQQYDANPWFTTVDRLIYGQRTAITDTTHCGW